MDIRASNHGSIWILTGISDAGKGWLDESLPEDAQRWGDGYVVEPRYVEDILIGASNDGMVVG